MISDKLLTKIIFVAAQLYCCGAYAAETYLSLPQTSRVAVGWGKPGDNVSVEGTPLRICEIAFPHGVGLHANAELVFPLDGKQRWLTFYAGVDDETDGGGSVALHVFLDGTKVYESAVLRGSDDPVYVSLPLNSAKELRFLGTDGGDGNGRDHLDLCNVRVSDQTQEPRPDGPKRVKVVALTDVSSVIPPHGTASVKPAAKWENALAAGNGIMGAMLYGDPIKDTILVNHCKLWLPAGSREILSHAGEVLPEMRRIIREQGYEAGQGFFLQKARDAGWDGHLVWTDAFHPGFFLKLSQPNGSNVTDYVRVEDFTTGEIRAQWRTSQGDFARRLFVSKTDNTIVSTTTGPKGKVSLSLKMEKLDNNLIDSKVVYTNGWILCHNIYVKGKGGYDGAVRVTANGGRQYCDSNSISVSDADSVTLLIRILPWRTPLPQSQAWPNDPANPDFAGGFHPAKRETVQIAGTNYDARWMAELKSDLASMPVSYAKLFKPHAAAWGKMYNRVSIDLGGTQVERAMSSEALLGKAQQEQRLSPALLERMYDAGRYVYMCAAGPQTPPNLFGIWTGTWKPAWSGDYTTDTNLQLDNELAFSANLAELLDGYYYLWNSYLPDFRRNAKSLYDCRGILTGSRASNNGLALHWDSNWPGNLWTPGASWIAHWYYDCYQYTGDRAFLRTNAIPFMKECALFWEDFLKGTEDATGHYTFTPSYSAENGWGDNASQDVEITTELLQNLIAGCETLGIEADGVVRWKAMLVKLPPLLVNNEGQLKEWSNPAQGEHNDHRHLMHLYGVFESQQFNKERDPKLFAAAKMALLNRVKASREDATHGYMHTGLAAASLGMGDLAFQRIEELAKRRSIYPSMVDGHYGGPRVLCDDGNGTTPEIVARMLVQSEFGKIVLLPALPRALPNGSVKGLRVRGGFEVDLTWRDGKLTSATVHSILGTKCTVHYLDKTADVSMRPGGKRTLNF